MREKRKAKAAGKAVASHLKHDIKEQKEGIKEDKMLMKKLKKGGK